jgi:hypothetical protein
MSDIDAISTTQLDDWLQEKSMMTALIQQHLMRAQKRMKT